MFIPRTSPAQVFESVMKTRIISAATIKKMFGAPLPYDIDGLRNSLKVSESVDRKLSVRNCSFRVATRFNHLRR